MAEIFYFSVSFLSVTLFFSIPTRLGPHSFIVFGSMIYDLVHQSRTSVIYIFFLSELLTIVTYNHIFQVVITIQSALPICISAEFTLYKISKLSFFVKKVLCISVDINLAFTLLNIFWQLFFSFLFFFSRLFTVMLAWFHRQEQA